MFLKKLQQRLNKIWYDFYIWQKRKSIKFFFFKNDFSDKKSYDFIKTKDECLAFMELNNEIPKKIEESDLE